METTKFKEMMFDEPMHMTEEIKFDEIDVRCKMNPNGHELEPKQRDVELERMGVLEKPFLESLHGLAASQTICIKNDRIVCLTTGGFYRMHHLHWLESLGNLEAAVQQGSWIKIFAKARKIFLGKIRGFRIKEKDNMRDQLKDMINTFVFQMLHQWRLNKGADAK